MKDGDMVLFGKWSGTEVKIDGQEYLIMKESTSWVSSNRNLIGPQNLNKGR